MLSLHQISVINRFQSIEGSYFDRSNDSPLQTYSLNDDHNQCAMKLKSKPSTTEHSGTEQVIVFLQAYVCSAIIVVIVYRACC